MLKKLLVIIFLSMLTITTVMPEAILAKGRRGKPVATKKGGKAVKAKAGKGGRNAVAKAKASKAKSSRYVARGGKKRGRRTSESIVSRAPGVAIPPERVREIQTALIREGYLQGEPSGQYDRTTVDAMSKYQQDNRFRTTGYPTAESLQKLGLTRQRRVTQPNPTLENKPDESSSSDSSTLPQSPNSD